MSTNQPMKYIKSLAGRPYHIKTHATYAQVKVMHGDKFYLGRIGGDTLRRIHRKATQAEQYAKQVSARLNSLRLRWFMDSIKAKQLEAMPGVSAESIALAPQEEMATA